jgi:DNA-binding transcriptional regulator GbsR (MarR family)
MNVQKVLNVHEAPMSESVEREAELLAADAIGDVIEHWGFRKALGRAWTMLYLADDALGAAELGERLSMSAGAVSMTLTELQRWGVVRRVWKPGERREFYEAETDFWKMISRVVHDRERSLVTSVRERLEQSRALLRKAPSTAANRARVERVGRLHAFASMAESVIGSFLASRRADFSEFSNLLQLSRPSVVGALRGRRG